MTDAPAPGIPPRINPTAGAAWKHYRKIAARRLAGNIAITLLCCHYRAIATTEFAPLRRRQVDHND